MVKIERSAINIVHATPVCWTSQYVTPYTVQTLPNLYISKLYSSKLVIFIKHMLKVWTLVRHSEQIGFCVAIYVSLRSPFNCLGLLFTKAPMSALLTPLFNFKSAIFISTDIRIKMKLNNSPLLQSINFISSQFIKHQQMSLLITDILYHIQKISRSLTVAKFVAHKSKIWT